MTAGVAAPWPATDPGTEKHGAAPLDLTPGHHEQIDYTIEHSLLGAIGQINLIVHRPAGSEQTDVSPILLADGRGAGSILGFGREAHQFHSEFDVTVGMPLRWSMKRAVGDGQTFDGAVQTRAGVVQMRRQRDDRPDENATFGARGPVFDPLGLLLFIRTQPFEKTLVVPVLQGRNLWHVTVFPPRPDVMKTRIGDSPALVFDLVAEPLTWSREKSTKRNARKLHLWVTADNRRTPLRLVSDTDLGQLNIVADRTFRGAGTIQMALR